MRPLLLPSLLPPSWPCKAAPASSSAVASTSHKTTAAPDASMRLAIAKPIPRAPPVTIAVRFLRSMVFIGSEFIRSFPILEASSPSPRGGGRDRSEREGGYPWSYASVRSFPPTPSPPLPFEGKGKCTCCARDQPI